MKMSITMKMIDNIIFQTIEHFLISLWLRIHMRCSDFLKKADKFSLDKKCNLSQAAIV